MPRIAIAGFQHETNTFGATKARFEDFERADSWPGLLKGAAVISGMEGINLPIAGFIEAARAEPEITLIPILWCAAEPSAHVEDAAFERIAGMILDGLRAAGPLDGVYLDLHGAMVTESHEDGEGALLARLRTLLGPDAPICVSLDLHANLTARMVANASAFTIFRTYPHLDMAETGARAFGLMRRMLAGERFRAAFRPVPFLIPLTAQYTGAAPCSEIVAALPAPGDAVHAEFAMGFPPADTPETGPAAYACAPTQAEADAAAAALLARIEQAEPRFDGGLVEAGAAVRRAMAAPPGKPVVIADVQDNPGAGAPSDSAGLLAALVENGARGAALAMLNDPEIAARAHRLGPGATFEAALGGKAGFADQPPFAGRFRVEAVSDGRFAFSGAMYAGAVAEVGPTALLRVLDPRAEVRVVVGSVRCQALDRAVFAHLGLDPAAQRILAVKSTVHFRADFDPIAQATLYAEAPGANLCRTESIPYRRLRPDLRRAPRKGLPRR